MKEYEVSLSANFDPDHTELVTANSGPEAAQYIVQKYKAFRPEQVWVRLLGENSTGEDAELFVT